MDVMTKNRDINMLEGPALKEILLFSLPIFIGSVFQMMYNLVDSIVVGQFVGANALAAVGGTSTISMLLVGIMNGFCTGSSIVIAQLLGQGRTERIKPAISTTVVFLLGLAIGMTALGLGLSRQFMVWTNMPEEIFDDALEYFRIYMVGLLFLTLYNFFAAFLRALGDSTTPLVFLIISSVLNILLDVVFVVVFGLGVAGVGYATVLAQGVSVLLCALWVWRINEYFRFQKSEITVDRALLKQVLRLGIPSALQGSAAGLGMVIVQGLINSFGPVSMAAYSAAGKMESLCSLPQNAVGMALSVFVGQNVGAANLGRCREGLRKGGTFIVAVCLLLSIGVYFCGPLLMRIFVGEADREVIDIGASFMRIWALFLAIHAVYEAFSAFLRGAGDSMFSMYGMFADLTTRVIMAYFFAKGLGMGFMGIGYAIPCGWVVCSVLVGVRYASGRWKSKAVV